MVLRLGILISGKGSNMLNIMNACKKNVLNAEVCIVITNNLNSLGIGKAEKQGIKTEIINPKPFINNETYEKSITEKLKENIYSQLNILLRQFMQKLLVMPHMQNMVLKVQILLQYSNLIRCQINNYHTSK